MNFNLNEYNEEPKIKNTLAENKIIRRDFEWTSKFFDHMNRTTYNFAKRLVDTGVISDVYLDETTGNPLINIEYLMDCTSDLKDVTKVITEVQKGIRKKEDFETFKIPYNMDITINSGCRRRYENGCEYYGCPIILAGYIFHMTRNLNRPVKDPNIPMNADTKETKKETLKEILTEELIGSHNEILNEINKNIYLTMEIKEEFCKLIRKLDNYKKFKKIIEERPNLNFAFTDDTDTIHPLCTGQEECIKQYIRILEYFEIIEKDSPIKTIDFKELTEKDFFNNKDNYNEKIIILKNIYLLSIKDTTEITNDRQLNVSIIKTKFASYIMKNSNDKIFIICDKSVNVKNFYSNYNQLKIIFNTLNIPSLKVTDVFNIFMNKLSNIKKEIKVEENFTSNLKKYLELHYPYSPYQNLEFVKYLFNTCINDTLNTNHPGVLKTEDFPQFKTNKLEGENALNELVGLDNVKEEVRNLKNFLEFKNNKEASGSKMPKIDLHMVYLGNPGTGKTTVARMMADILFNLGYIRYNKCLETEAKDFIASIPGATALKTNEKIQEALGGVLFIDEAYALGESEYGKECIAALIKSMEDFRDDLVIILAGYEIEMNRFLEINSGFKSRIAYYFDFKDYTNEELYQMFEYHFTNYGFRIEHNETRARINQICDLAKKQSSFGNGRFVRQKVEEILRQHAINCIDETNEEIKNHLIMPKDIKLY